MKENKKKMIITIVSVIVLVVIVLTAAYAYFVVQTGDAAQTNVSVTAETTDSLQFKTGGAINITANQDNFASGKGNRSDSTTASAILIAGKNTEADYNYYLYLNIDNNDFQYTTEAKTPELVLKVILEDQPYKNVSGLTYNETIGGYDITEVDGLITIADNYNIKTTTTKTDNWKVEIVLVNLDSDQNANTGKTFTGEVLIQKDKKKVTLAKACVGEKIAECFKNNYMLDNSIIYHAEEVAIQDTTEVINGENGAGDNSYRYAGLNPNNYVCFGSDETTCPTENLYRIIGLFNDSIINEAGNDTGKKEYRIKLIKDDFANSDILGADGDYSTSTFSKSRYANYKGNKETINRYYWNSINVDLAYKEKGDYNIWSYSELNKTNLNKNYIDYLDNIDPKWAQMIATTKWSVGGMDWAATKTVKQYYDAELNYSTPYPAKIGLMYLSDYGYAASPENWTTELSKYNNETNTKNNWMYSGIIEWTISRDSSLDSYSAFYVKSNGAVDDGLVDFGISSVRPSFSLSSDVVYVGGTGTSTDPYRISL